MAHFAKIKDGIVEDCIVVSNDNCGGVDFPESESLGKDFISSLGIGGDWIQTSYNNNFRGKFAGKGMYYNPDKDCFHRNKPFNSWTLDSNGDWNPPIKKPQDGKFYDWDEDQKNWVEHT